MRQRPYLESDHTHCGRAVKTANQSIPPNGGYAVTWDSMEYDIPGSPTPMWTSANPTQVYARHPGIYSVNASAAFAVQLGGFRLFYLMHYPANVLKSIHSEGIAGGGFYTGHVVSAELSMAAMDYVELWVYHNHTANLNIDVAATAFLSLRMTQPTSYTDWAGS